MIKLKNILSEIDIRGGDASVLGSFIDWAWLVSSIDGTGRCPITARKVWNAVGALGGLMYRGGYKGKLLPLDEQIKNLNTLGNKVYSSGSTTILKIEEGKRNVYLMYDTNIADGKTCVVVGLIVTTDAPSEFFYSESKSFDVSVCEQIHWSALIKEYRGSGFGKILYDTVLNNVDALYSDSILFSGSFNMWTNHMAKNGFFGGQTIHRLNAPSIILPIDPSNIKNTNMLRRNFFSFFTIKDRNKVPIELRKMEHNLNGVDLIKQCLFIHSKSAKAERFEGIVEDAVDFSSLLKYFDMFTISGRYDDLFVNKASKPDKATVNYLEKNIKVVIAYLGDSMYLVKRKMDGLTCILL